MSTLTSLARAVALERGRAQPACTVRHLHVSGRPLVFIPLALAGEAGAPLAAMAGADPDSPRLLVVPQPRNRDQRFAFAADLAAVIVPYIESFFRALEPVPGGREPRSRFADAPQILVPGPAALGFTRLLGRSTRFWRSEGAYAVPEPVPLLGRWLTYLAERAEYPGSSLLVAATGALALHWASGQSPVEDLNLAALLGWIDPPAGLTGAEAAAAAEDPVAWPPAGPATDPTFDNEVLAPLMAAHDRAAASGDGRSVRRARSALEDVLAGQLSPTWRLMWQAVRLLRRASRRAGMSPRGGTSTRTRSPHTRITSAKAASRSHAATRRWGPPASSPGWNGPKRPTAPSGRSTTRWGWPSTGLPA